MESISYTTIKHIQLVKLDHRYKNTIIFHIVRVHQWKKKVQYFLYLDTTFPPKKLLSELVMKYIKGYTAQYTLDILCVSFLWRDI